MKNGLSLNIVNRRKLLTPLYEVGRETPNGLQGFFSLCMIEIGIDEILLFRPARKSHSDYSFGGWYLIENTKTNMKYIGKSIDFMHRLKQHLKMKNPKMLIDNEINRYGHDSFKFYLIKHYNEVGVNFFNRKIECEIENKMIIEFKTNYPFGYNIRFYE